MEKDTINSGEMDHRLPDRTKQDEGSKDGIDVNDEHQQSLAEALDYIEQKMTPKVSEPESRALYQALATGKNRITVPHPQGNDGLAAVSIQKLLTIVGNTAINNEVPGFDINKFQALVSVNQSLRQSKDLFWYRALSAVRKAINATGVITVETLSDENLILETLKDMMMHSKEDIIENARTRIASLRIKSRETKNA